MQLDLRTIAGAIGQPLAQAAAETLVTSVVSDSREVRPGSLFACVRGERVDGHDFAVQACETGAAVILAEREPEGLKAAFPDVPLLVVPDTIKALGQIARAWRERFKGTVIGLTGTAGKTTTKEWLASVLARSGAVAKTEGNHNNQLGLPLSMLAATGQETYWIFECGVSHEGDMEELAEILRPDLGIVLNVGEGHTEGLGEKGVAWHKTRLFTLLAEGGRAIASADYPDLVRQALDACPETVFFSAQAEGPDTVTPVCRVVPAAAHAEFSLRLVLDGREQKLTVRLPMDGPAAAENLACVALVCAELGVDPAHIEEGLAKTAVPGHRFRHVDVGRCHVIDDCYNANPLSMSRMLEAAAAEAAQYRSAFACVLGEMGELGSMAADAHKRLGAQLAKLDPVFVAWKGGHAEDVATHAGSVPFFLFKSDEELEKVLEAVRQSVPGNMTVLIKGSRSNRLETSVPVFEKLFAVEAANVL